MPQYLTLAELAQATGLKVYQARYMIQRNDVPESQLAGMAKLYHPWCVAWILESLADQRITAERNEVRVKALKAAIRKGQSEKQKPADLGVGRFDVRDK